MKQLSRVLVAAAALVVAAGCEQESQRLPFSVAPEAPVTRSIPAGGGTLSTAAGASVQFPAGAVAGGTTVSLASGAPAAGTQRSGTPVSPGFRLEPEGLSLSQRTPVELRAGAPETAKFAYFCQIRRHRLKCRS